MMCVLPLRRYLMGSLFLAASCLAQTPTKSGTEGAAKPAAAPTAPASPTENAVVKVFTTARYPDLSKPWTKQAPVEATGTGVVIEGRRILTNAHVVLYASQVQVQANQSGDKITARVVAISPGIDLALLALEDESFFDTRPALVRAAELPQVKDTILVQGFPTGGTSLSTTKGIVSRIDFTGYNFPMAGLRIQIDAAINPGNSGGPALIGDKMIGVAFSRLGGGDNIGYIIPNEEIELFLADAADGTIHGKPGSWDSLQTLHNPALREFLKPAAGTEGIVVNHADTRDPNYPLKAWDIITHIGDTPVDHEGMIKLGPNLRVAFRYMIQKLARNGVVPLTVMREGKALKLDVPVANSRPMLLKSLAGAYPPYFIYGPMVFSAGSQEFVGGLNNAAVMALLSAAGNPLVIRRGDQPAFEGEELVIVSSPFFPHKLSKGYSNPIGRVVKTVNGVAIRNLAHLVATLRDATSDFVAFEFQGREQERLVFPRKEMLAATEEILSDNGVRAQGSPDTMKVWEAGKS
ncbi:MAG TPA: trypsin-like peptidase domain-containing protein [Opitutaceae bacterium]|nr:trypsin-like peptidase domain-containing protein [Opitutaceae bacterium]HRE04351.1 trypsin-like peptidase domain-containing protein [Opitutaceae bacterium]